MPIEISSSRVVSISVGMDSKEVLFMAYANQLDFPAYFGQNWDAFLDCLRDLSWVKERNIVIEHAGLPLEKSPIESLIYLQILEAAIDSWNEYRPEVGSHNPESWAYVEHKIFVSFPADLESKISELRKVS